MAVNSWPSSRANHFIYDFLSSTVNKNAEEKIAGLSKRGLEMGHKHPVTQYISDLVKGDPRCQG
jgi:hypothetical protein